MRQHLRRCLLSAVAALLTLAVSPAGAARAAVDMQVVADAIDEAGYYVDSGSRYFKTDAALDLLRDTKEARVPVYVAVLPKGESPDAAITQLMGMLKRKGTYAVLAGDTLRIRSNSLPAAQVNGAYRKAVSANAGRPDKALVAFVRQLPQERQLLAKDPKAASKPLSETKVGEDQVEADEQAAVPEQTRPSAAKDDEGGLPVAALAGGLGALVVAVVGAVLLLRRRRAAGPAAAGLGAGAGSVTGPGPVAGPGAAASGPAAGSSGGPSPQPPDQHQSPRPGDQDGAPGR